MINVYVESGKQNIELGWFSPDPFKLPPPPSLPETILDLTQLSAVEKLKLKVSFSLIEASLEECVFV
jgi:hypothetical protein